MRAFLDTSVLLRILLGQPGALKDWAVLEERVGSALAEVECLRTLDRMRITGEISEDQNARYRSALYSLLETFRLLDISPAILRRASGAFPTAIGTLDAIHLSTALAWQDERGEKLTVATHDRSFGKAAAALGFRVEGLDP